MRRVMCEELGPPDTLKVVDTDPVEPRPDQVVIGVRAAGVNFVDALFVAGQYQIKPPLPFTPGSEVAGEIVRTGTSVTGFATGDRVLAMCGLGGYASEVAVSELQLARVPDAMSFGQAAAFMQSYCTAMFALRDRARIEPGESVLVLGAGGGVGLATIDVAKALGAHPVIAAASSAGKLAAATGAGADATIDYSSDDLKARARELSGGGVDVVIDPVGGDLTEAALRSLGLFGRLVVIGFASGTIPKLPANQILLRNRSVIGVDWGAWSMQFGADNATLLAELLDLAGSGRLNPGEPASFALDDVASALNALTSRSVTGKVVLVP